MRVAITAASGKLGAAIVAATAAEIGADNVVALARTPTNAAHLGVEVRPGSYDDRDELVTSLAGIDRVLLVSGMDAPDQRIGQHRNVIEAARSNHVQKIVYTSIQGPASGTAFSPVVQSNRQTEDDVRASGLAWAIGRNGIYIEPDVEYASTYAELGEITNCAGEGRCAYTTRPELAYAYARMLTGSAGDGQTYSLSGEPITQTELATLLGDAMGVPIGYRSMSFEDYRTERVAELGDFIGTVVAGIYQGIRDGAYDTSGDFQAAAGRPHQSWADFFADLKSVHTGA
ncbi:NAD(P)H-binding protein [Aeromicrobium sp. A1-2]|uniref:NAD(P)H-binding protein n=1 Tax=Aeromicrobium sp. A1-2 TaxID=2107713 RepID=UPI0013C2A662|nr:NAD(P)H-binding protein [Aeromicrobium sp. A1-2]